MESSSATVNESRSASPPPNSQIPTPKLHTDPNSQILSSSQPTQNTATASVNARKTLPTAINKATKGAASSSATGSAAGSGPAREKAKASACPAVMATATVPARPASQDPCPNQKQKVKGKQKQPWKHPGVSFADSDGSIGASGSKGKKNQPPAAPNYNQAKNEWLDLASALKQADLSLVQKSACVGNIQKKARTNADSLNDGASSRTDMGPKEGYDV
ncbi:hypothetical protein CCACVL1_06192 [Corchorus capsularis]|uniref:Uncharacterized protein n=1 Tax=Corchorus capsularis TaxID=210143 RepID=A0A1R3JGW1_COCAP|nr:hypothetical protein CCACVL1_06192 [Corchorus capsularis]